MKDINKKFITNLSLDDFIKEHFSKEEIEKIKNTVSYRILKELEEGNGN